MKKLWIHSATPFSKTRLRRLYESVIPTVKRVARRCGYAIAVHGSLTRDCDLMAMPWVKKAVLPMTLAHRIHKAVSKYALTPNGFKKQGTIKPHGRTGYVIYFGCFYRRRKGHAIYIDLSVMPPQR